MVKFLTALAVAAVALPAMAFAETPAKTGVEEAAPLDGANSFTENQARKRVEDAGYTKVGTMQKDDKGVWRTMAMKDGASVAVAVDFKGNVTTTPGKVSQ